MKNISNITNLANSIANNRNNASTGINSGNRINVSETNLTQRSRQRMPQLPQKQVINAIITSKTAETAVLREASGFTFQAGSSDVRGEVGDSVSFEVLSNTRNGLVIRQMEQEQAQTRFKKELAKQANLADLKDLMEANEFVGQEINVLDQSELAEATLEERFTQSRALASIRRQASFISDNAAAAAVKALLAEGVKVTKLELSSLSSMLAAIKKDPGINLPPSNEVKSPNFLVALDIPETQRNTAQAEEAARKINVVQEIEVENIVMYLSSGANSDKVMSLDNLYNYAKSVSAVIEETNPVPADEIKRVFALEGIEASTENLKTAWLFIAAGVPVNKENIDKFNFLVSMKDMSPEDLQKRVLLAGKQGNGPLSSDFYNVSDAEPLSYENYEELVKKVSVITTEHIEIAIMRDFPMTIKDLAAVAENAPYQLPNYVLTNFDLSEENAARAKIARMELLEISLKLTYEAANALHQRQIQLDVLTLTDALETLKEREREMYANRLNAVGAPATAENIGRVAETMDAARKMRILPSGAVGDIIAGRVVLTMRALSEYPSAPAAAATAERTAAMYTAYEAKPTARYGDRIVNEKQQLANLLESLGIEATDANIKAAKIAAANNMDINNENLLTIKAVDAKLNDVSTKLGPMIAAQMVKDGYNPLDRHIDEVLKYIETFDGMYGEEVGETLAEKIYAMDKAKTLDPESRETMMAIYKALHIIRKNGMAAIGAALKTEAALTLGRLLELAETLNKSVDISAGSDALKFRPTSGRVLRNILNSAEAKTDAEYYGMRMLDSLAKNLSPAAIKDKNLLKTNIETLAEALAQNRERQPGHAEMLEQAREMAKQAVALQSVPAETMKRLGNAGVPLTLQNIGSYRRISGGKVFGDFVNETTNESAKEAVLNAADTTSLDRLAESGFEDYIRDIYTAIEAIAEKSTDDAERVNNLLDSMRILYHTGAKNGYYLPVKFNGRLADVNVYVIEDLNKVDLRVEMLLDTLIGEVRVKLELAGEELTNAAITVNGADLGYSEGFMSSLADYTSGSGTRNLNKLPPHIKNAASAALKYAENLEARG